MIHLAIIFGILIGNFGQHQEIHRIYRRLSIISKRYGILWNNRYFDCNIYYKYI